MTTTIPTTRATADSPAMTDAIVGTEFHLAIVGGCMSHQPGIPFNALYHRQLAREAEGSAGLRLRSHVARGFGLDFGVRLDALQERFALDGVLLHLRVTVVKRARLVVRVRSAHGRRSCIHPALFSRRHVGAAVEELRAAENAGEDLEERGLARAAKYERKRARLLAGFNKQEVYSALGALVGLDRWAADDEVHRLADFVADCERRGLPLFILGPTPLTGQRWAARSVRLLDERVARFAAQRGLPYARVAAERDSAGRPVVKRDGMHLTIEGHGFVARRLLDAGFADWAHRQAAGRA
jgi:hypothetical protein